MMVVSEETSERQSLGILNSYFYGDHITDSHQIQCVAIVSCLLDVTLVAITILTHAGIYSYIIIQKH